jgi:hypothetical protein
MIWYLSISAILIAGLFSVRRTLPRETTLTLSATIGRPASSVFKIIEDAERAIEWRRRPHWLPAPLRLSMLSCWGEPLPVDRNAGTGTRCREEEIRIRCLQDRELEYSRIRRNDLSYESTFRLMPADGQCLLTWQIRYQAHRLADILGRTRIATASLESMANSLDFIDRLARSRQEADVAHSHIYEAHRGQVPAA